MKVKSLYFYPIKGGRFCPVQSIDVGPSGMAHDREFCLVDQDGVFVSQRSLPQLAQIQSILIDEPMELKVQIAEQRLSILVHSAFQQSAQIQIWQDKITVQVAESHVNDWFSQQLQKPLKLVRVVDKMQREGTLKYQTPLTLVDAQPLLILSQASVEEFQRRAEADVPVEVFRPNIVLSDLALHEEDELDEIQLGDVRLKRTKQCTRCKVTTLDPFTGEGTYNSLQILSQYRRIKNAIAFGSYYKVITPGRLSTF